MQENDPLLHGISEAQEAMADFEAALNDNSDVNLDAMIENLNEDQLRIIESQEPCAQPMHTNTNRNCTTFAYVH